MTRRSFAQDGPLADEPLHYKACGLDDVFLLNGFIREATDYGDGVAISALDELHEAIAFQIIGGRKRISAREFRFLRKQMDNTQAELAALLGVDAQTVARYEKGETPISGSADHLVRFLFCMQAREGKALLACLAQVRSLIEADEPAHDTPAYFRMSRKGWIEDGPPMAA
jgi:transcriptional regulator with XRE-family HTH domain